MSDCIELRVDRWVQTELGLRAEFGTGYADPGFARLVKGCGYTRVVCHFDQAQVVRVGRELTYAAGPPAPCCRLHTGSFEHNPYQA